MKWIAVGGCAAVLAIGATTMPWLSTAAPAAEADCSTAPSIRTVLVEQSSSNRSQPSQDSRLAFVERALIESAICDTALSVVAWSSFASVVELWGSSNRLEVPGGTERARANRVLPVVEGAMDKTLLPRWDAALSELPSDRSDVASWPTIAVDLLPSDRPRDGDIDVVVLTDGVHVGEGLDLNTLLSVDDAIEFADGLPTPPDLSGVSVAIAGVAQVDGSPPPAGGTWVEAVRAFNQRLCERTGAECRVTTTIGGGS